MKQQAPVYIEINSYNGYKACYMDGKLHRLDGPAVEYASGTKYWYIDGNELTEAEFRSATSTKEVHEMTLDDIAARLGIPVKSLKIVKEH